MRLSQCFIENAINRFEYLYYNIVKSELRLEINEAYWRLDLL